MPVRVRWNDDGKRSILAEFEPGWAWADYLDATVEMTAMMATVSHTVDLIADIRGTAMPPPGQALQTLAKAFNTAPDNLGLNVVVGANPVIRTILHLLKTVTMNKAASNFRFTDTAAAAEQVLLEEWAAQAAHSEAG